MEESEETATNDLVSLQFAADKFFHEVDSEVGPMVSEYEGDQDTIRAMWVFARPIAYLVLRVELVVMHFAFTQDMMEAHRF